MVSDVKGIKFDTEEQITLYTNSHETQSNNIIKDEINLLTTEFKHLFQQNSNLQNNIITSIVTGTISAHSFSCDFNRAQFIINHLSEITGYFPEYIASMNINSNYIKEGDNNLTLIKSIAKISDKPQGIFANINDDLNIVFSQLGLTPDDENNSYEIKLLLMSYAYARRGISSGLHFQ